MDPRAAQRAELVPGRNTAGPATNQGDLVAKDATEVNHLAAEVSNMALNLEIRMLSSVPRATAKEDARPAAPQGLLYQLEESARSTRNSLAEARQSLQRLLDNVPSGHEVEG